MAAKAKRPDKLYIEPFCYAIDARPEWSLTTGNMGNCSTDSQTIYIDAGLTEQSERDTILHEALHAIIAQTDLQKSLTEKKQEDVCWQLAPRLLALLKDNPDFIRWLVGK